MQGYWFENRLFVEYNYNNIVLVECMSYSGLGGIFEYYNSYIKSKLKVACYCGNRY